MHNFNCDGASCTQGHGQVRLLPTGGDGNVIVCYQCYLNEIEFRTLRNLETGMDLFKLPEWEDLKIYETGS